MIKITFGIETVIRIKKAIHKKIININKYVKGNSSLYCGSNIFNSGGVDYYSFNTLTTNDAAFDQNKSYTIGTRVDQVD